MRLSFAAADRMSKQKLDILDIHILGILHRGVNADGSADRVHSANHGLALMYNALIIFEQRAMAGCIMGNDTNNGHMRSVSEIRVTVFLNEIVRVVCFSQGTRF